MTNDTKPTTEKKTTKLQVINEDARIYVFPLNPDGGKRLQLTPGLNLVDPKAWSIIVAEAEADAESLARHLLADGRLQEMGEGDSLKGMAISKAKTLIGRTLNRKILRDWETDESRPTVQKALAAQLARVDGSQPDA